MKNRLNSLAPILRWFCPAGSPKAWGFGLYALILCVSWANLLAAEPSELAPAGSASKAVEIWLCVGERIAELLRPEAEWSFVKQHLSGIKLYVDQINQATPEQLADLVRLVKAHGYQVAVELGGCLDFAPMDDTAGEWSARHELAKINQFYAAGGQVDFLDLDGPIRRLMHPENRRDGQRFDSLEKAANELVVALKLHQQAHPKTKFWLLTNFPNWGYRGDVSYHARGPHRQDYGDYDGVIRVVLRKLRAVGILLAGVTVDNPYDYLIGEHSSVNLQDAKTVNWLKRVRDYEDYVRAQGLEFNLIANSERGGYKSDELFYRETLQMVETYRKAGGRPTRWFIQSWYPYPKQMAPEAAPYTLTALVKAVIEQVGGRLAIQSRIPSPARPRKETRRTRVIESLTYGKETPEAQVLSAYLVPARQPSPVLVQIISGGWNSSPPRGTNLQPFQAYLDAGLSVVMVAHRPIGDTVRWPAPADDVARAIQFIRAHADEWNTDPKRVAVKGRSSGGHVALMVGFGPDRANPQSNDVIERQSSRPTCILAGSAPTDLVQQMRELLNSANPQDYLWERMRALVGAGKDPISVEELLPRLKPLSPIEYVSKDSPPVFLMHSGPTDAFWPGDPRLKWDVHTPITGLILARKLKELGVPHELVILPEDRGRGGAGLFLERELTFLRRYLDLKNLIREQNTSDGGSPNRYPSTHTMRSVPSIEKSSGRNTPGIPEAATSARIVLQPQPGAMQVTARVPLLNNQAFALGIPETIGCREAMLLNFPEAKIDWQGPDANGVVSCSWGPGGRIFYSLRLVPTEDYVEVKMTVRNHTEFLWHDVFAFNCLNPIQAPDFQDWKLDRTYMSAQGKPLCMAKTTRIKGPMPTVGFYLPERIKSGQESIFVRGFQATSPDRTDGSWIITLSKLTNAYVACAAMDAAFLFDNLDRCCIHAAPNFGDLPPGESSTTVSRIYLAQGSLEDFLKRYEADRSLLTARERRAQPLRNPADKAMELTKWDKADQYLPASGPGGTEWDAQYRSFIQTDENAASKGFPTHAEAAQQIQADAMKSPVNLQKHKGWILFIKHYSQAYRPESATLELKKLYEVLVTSEFGGKESQARLPFEDDPRITIHRNVAYGKSHPIQQQLDAYLVKSRVRPSELARQPLRGQGFANAFTAAFACTPEQYEQEESVRKRIRDASPVFLVTADDPPALMIGAASEEMRVAHHPPIPEVINDPHSAWHEVLLADQMAAAGVPVDTRVGPSVGRDIQADTQAVLRFLRQRLSAK